MSLYGALFASVAGLEVQSNEIGAISNNIANVNTVGYKDTTTAFETLVTSSGQTSSFNPGGVLSATQSDVGEQGQIQGTSSPTDLAISGNGFFVVNSSADGSGNELYTRAGSFTQDNLGNFVNSAGFYLQGWPLDRNGQLPGAAGNADTNSANNLSSLQTVNVVSATGSAAETTTVSLSSNLQATQTTYPGAGASASMDSLGVNFDQPASDIIVPDQLNLPSTLNGVTLTTGEDSAARGDQFTVSTGGGLKYTYTYGGFSYGRDITSGDAGDSGQAVETSPVTLAAGAFSITNGNNDVKVTMPHSGLVAGDVVTISGQNSAIQTVSGSAFDGTFLVTSVDNVAGTVTIDVPGASVGTTGTGGDVGVSVVTRPFAGNVLDANTPSSLFLGTTGTSGFSATALTFNITTGGTTSTFTYTTSTPNTQIGQFNTLNSLAAAINNVSGLTARVEDNRLFVGAKDANAAVTFGNGSATGNGGPPVTAGIDWVGELGLQNVAAGQNQFNSLSSLNTLVNASTGLTGTLTNPLTNAALSINVSDPLDTISYADAAASTPVTYTNATPFSTSAGNNVVTVTSTTATGLKTGDLVKLNSTGMASYPSPLSIGVAMGDVTLATTSTSPTVTITLPSAYTNPFANGNTVYIDPSSIAGYPSGTLNGIPLTDLSGNFTVSGVSGQSFNITAAVDATSTTSMGTSAGSGTMLISPTFGGIPMTEFNGQFAVTVTGPDTYTIQLPTKASASVSTGEAGLVVTPPENSGSVLAALGLVTSLDNTSYTPKSLGPLGPEYDPSDASKNMAGGTITPQFSQDVQIFDALGTAHNLKVSFIKTGTNTWAAEVYAADTSDVSSAYTDGLLASGTVTFNGDGTLRSVSSGLATPVNINWSDGSSESSVTFNWGTAGDIGTGKTDGMSQFADAFAVNFANQNGNAVGQLTSVTVTADGFVVANFNNGQSENLYQLPLAVFSAPDQLTSSSGNVYAQSNSSGTPNLRQPGTSGAGKLDPSALETSTVDLASELTNLIVAQRAYEANTKVITTDDTLLQDLNQAIQA